MKELELLKSPIFWLGMILILVWLAIWQLPDNRLHLVFCDVGQGDAILISHLSRQVLIDGGPDNRVLDCLADNLPFWDRTIEMVILTHPEADHFTGLIDVIERYDIKQIVVNSIINDSSGFWDFYRVVLEEGTEIYSPRAGDKIRLGPMEFLILWPEEKLGDERMWRNEKDDALVAHQDFDSASDSLAKNRVSLNEIHRRSQGEVLQNLMGSPRQVENILGAALYSGEINETSIVLQLSFGKFDALFTGDISFDTEKRIGWLDPPAGGRQIEILKVAHHGSKYSTGEEFLEKIRPLLAVISVGKNPWGHPTEEVIKRLTRLIVLRRSRPARQGNQAIEFLRTDQRGEIEIISDGERWGIKK